MTPDLNPGLHAMPDWGDKIAIVPASKSKQNDATYRSIASSMQNVLAAAHLETVKAGSGEKYRMSIDWSVSGDGAQYLAFAPEGGHDHKTICTATA